MGVDPAGAAGSGGSGVASGEPAVGRYVCADCRRRVGEDELRWRCGCGGLLDPVAPRPFDRALVDQREPGIWRYAAALPSVEPSCRVTLGERRTPLVPWTSGDGRLWLKLESLLPTGSYKDRGAAVMVSKLRSLGVRAVMDDSSGNAGAALAAYAASAGMRCIVLAPAGNSPAKHAQIRAYGAELRPIHGDRDAAVALALRDLGDDVFYASHNRHPAFLEGVATMGLELFEDLGDRLPRSIVVPAGHGSIVLGLWHAFRALQAGGAIGILPRIFAIQSAARPAVAEAWARGATEVAAVDRGVTIAEGIAATRPTRGRQLLAALRETAGAAVAVSDAEIVEALRALGGAGFYVEPTSAVTLAGLRRLRRDGLIAPHEEALLVLTGSGLKSAWADLVGVA